MTHLSTDTCLNLVMPRGLEEAVSDLLLAHPELRASFTACRVEAHGDGVELRSASEHVRGHADRIRMELLLSQQDTERVLDYLRQNLPNPAIFYWTTPILTAGKLA